MFVFDEDGAVVRSLKGEREGRRGEGSPLNQVRFEVRISWVVELLRNSFRTMWRWDIGCHQHV